MKALVSALVVAALLPAAAAADLVGGEDRQNAARACKSLQTTMGASFAQTYRNFGACVSKWTQEQHQNRHQAEEACAAEGRKGGAFTRCVRSKLAEESAADVQATRNAAKRCKAEKVRAAAFGKCVSQRAEAADD